MKKTDKHDSIVYSSGDEQNFQSLQTQLLKNSPIPDDELLMNIGLYISSKNLSRLLFFTEIYKQIIHSHGVIMEFGTRWGQNMALLSALRGIYEPFNRHRKIIGFDTFDGFPELTPEDGSTNNCTAGSYSVSENYMEHLDQALNAQDQLNPVSHLKKYELVKGDANETIPQYIEKHPETVVSLAILDFDIYKPTKTALEAVKSRMPKGGVLVFDELCDEAFPGETIAVQEVFGLDNLRIQRLPTTSRLSYAIIE